MGGRSAGDVRGTAQRERDVSHPHPHPLSHKAGRGEKKHVVLTLRRSPKTRIPSITIADRRYTMDFANLTRRDALQVSAAALAATALPLPITGQPPRPPEKLIGIQVGAISFVDEGVEAVLDIV